MALQNRKIILSEENRLRKNWVNDHDRHWKRSRGALTMTVGGIGPLNEIRELKKHYLTANNVTSALTCISVWP